MPFPTCCRDQAGRDAKEPALAALQQVMSVAKPFVQWAQPAPKGKRDTPAAKHPALLGEIGLPLAALRPVDRSVVEGSGGKASAFEAEAASVHEAVVEGRPAFVVTEDDCHRSRACRRWAPRMPSPDFSVRPLGGRCAKASVPK